jgi:hypothetical protein
MFDVTIQFDDRPDGLAVAGEALSRIPMRAR